MRGARFTAARAAALRFLVEEAGVENVLLGSDQPFDMGTVHAVAEVEDAITDPQARAAILGGIVLFIVLGEFAGLAPATFALVFVAALGDRQSTWIGALVLAAIMTLMAGVLFWYLLQVQFPIWRLGGV